MYQWCKGQTRISRSASDHNLRVSIQSFDDRPCTEVNVCTLNSIANGRERGTTVHVSQLNSVSQKLIETAHDVVTGDDTNPHLTSKTKFSSNFTNGIGATFYVDAAGVCGYSDIAFDACRQDSSNQWDKV